MLNILTLLLKKMYLVVCWIIQHSFHFEQVQRRIVREKSLKFLFFFFPEMSSFHEIFS